jgi:hypothetical protein
MAEDEFVQRIEATLYVLRDDTSVNPFREDAIDKLEALLTLYRTTTVCPTCNGRGLIPKTTEVIQGAVGKEREGWPS